MEDKLRKIKELRTKGETLSEIGRKFHVTAERIRQILAQKEVHRCLTHKLYYKEQCYLCVEQEVYSKILLKLKKDNLRSEIRKLSVQDRSKEVVIRRKLLVKKLHDNYKMSFRKIGKELKRDHSTIMNLRSEER